MAEQSDIHSLIELLSDRMDRQVIQHQAGNDLLPRLLNQQEVTLSLHQNFRQQQEKFNERWEKTTDRQERFNIIFLDEIRGMKKGVKELTEVVVRQHEGQPKRLEDFMDGFLRKAG